MRKKERAKAEPLMLVVEVVVVVLVWRGSGGGSGGSGGGGDVGGSQPERYPRPPSPLQTGRRLVAPSDAQWLVLGLRLTGWEQMINEAQKSRRQDDSLVPTRGNSPRNEENGT